MTDKVQRSQKPSESESACAQSGRGAASVTVGPVTSGKASEQPREKIIRNAKKRAQIRFFKSDPPIVE